MKPDEPARTEVDRPSISIVTPSLNQGRMISDCLASVAAPSYPNVEHIVMDSGSTAETPGILERQPASGNRRGFGVLPARGPCGRKVRARRRDCLCRSPQASEPLARTSCRARARGRADPAASWRMALERRTRRRRSPAGCPGARPSVEPGGLFCAGISQAVSLAVAALPGRRLSARLFAVEPSVQRTALPLGPTKALHRFAAPAARPRRSSRGTSMHLLVS